MFYYPLVFLLIHNCTAQFVSNIHLEALKQRCFQEVSRGYGWQRARCMVENVRAWNPCNVTLLKPFLLATQKSIQVTILMLTNPHCFALQHLLTSKDILNNRVWYKVSTAFCVEILRYLFICRTLRYACSTVADAHGRNRSHLQENEIENE